MVRAAKRNAGRYSGVQDCRKLQPIEWSAQSRVQTRQDQYRTRPSGLAIVRSCSMILRRQPAALRHLDLCDTSCGHHARDLSERLCTSERWVSFHRLSSRSGWLAVNPARIHRNLLKPASIGGTHRQRWPEWKRRWLHEFLTKANVSCKFRVQSPPLGAQLELSPWRS
jgi:hypothetical protein